MNKEIAEEAKSDYSGSKMGMWLFLFTEMLLFSGLFLLYSAYRSRYPQEFHSAASELNRTIGLINTIILLTSSLTMAFSVNALKMERKLQSLMFQYLTIFFGLSFLVIKYFEWSAKISHGIYPNSPELLALGKGEIIFFGLYYLLTGLHGLHIIGGIILITIMSVMTRTGTVRAEQYVRLENTGLYWHLVDIIWVYLFPLFYLIN